LARRRRGSKSVLIKESIHQQLNRLLAQIGAKRSAARQGDESAEAWVAGLDHWLSQYRTGEVANDLIITYDILPLLRGYGAVLEFEKGYRFAATINAGNSGP
jgi:predicted transcriptional regulator